MVLSAFYIDSLLNPFIWLPAPLLRHENTARLLLQLLQPIRVANRSADCLGPPQGGIGDIYIAMVA